MEPEATIHNPNAIGVSLRDHDLLVGLGVEMKGVREDIKEIKDNSAERLNRLEDGKVDKKYLEDLVRADDEKQKTFATKEDIRYIDEKYSLSRKIVYSGSAIILAAVLSALVYLVVAHH